MRVRGSFLGLVGMALASVVACDPLQPPPVYDGGGGGSITPEGGGGSGFVPTGPIPADALLGPPATVPGGELQSFATRGPDGLVNQVGMRVPLAYIRAASTATAQNLLPAEVPEEVKRETFIQSLRFDNLPTGHAPKGVYDSAHFEIHYFTIPSADARAIDCKDRTAPPSDGVAPNFTPEPEPFNCLESVGIHAFDRLAPEFQGERFRWTFNLTYYAGRIAALEQKVIAQSLLERTALLDFPVDRAVQFQRAYPQGRYPRAGHARFLPNEDAYIFALYDFVDRQ